MHHRCICAPRPTARRRCAQWSSSQSNPHSAPCRFGPNDQFLNLFASLQKCLPVFPLAGAQALFQPVYVRDVARAFAAAIDCSESYGQVIELAGPRVYTLRELVTLAGRVSGHPRPIIGLPEGLARWQARLMELAPGPTLMSRDNLDSMRVPNIASAPLAPHLARLLHMDATATVEQIAAAYLSPMARQSRYDRYRRGAPR